MMRHDEPATMMHLIRPLLLLIGLVVLLVVADQAAGDSVRIHDVSGSMGPDVLLSQVAELEGDYANQYANVIVGRFEDGAAKVEITSTQVIDAITKQGVKLGKLDLRGFGRCVVHRTFADPAKPTDPDAPARSETAEPALTNIDARGGGEAVSIHTPTTVRALIERAIAERIGVDLASLQITFNGRDDELLNSSAVAGRYEVQPVAEPTLGRVSFKVYAYSGTRRVGSGQVVTAEVAQKVIAVIATEPIARGALINRRQVRLSEVLVDDPAQVYFTDSALVTGQVASRGLESGELVTAGEIKMPIAVRRRERVLVELKAPGVMISFNGMALAEGSVGESIEVENTKTGEKFLATIVSRGKVAAGPGTQANTEGKP